VRERDRGTPYFEASIAGVNRRFRIVKAGGLLLLTMLVVASAASVGAAEPAANTSGAGFFVIASNGTGPPTLLGNPTGYVADLSPNRTRIVLAPADPLTGSARRHVVVANLDGSNPVEIAPQLADASHEVDGATWAPSGKMIVIQAWNLTTCPPGSPSCATPELWLARANGAKSRKLAGRAVSPTWSPDSRKVAFMGSYRTNEAKGAATVVNTDGKALKRIGPTEVASDAFFQLSWAPAGGRLAYIPASHCTSRSTSCIKVLSAKGGRPLRLAPAVESFSWSPGGERLAFVEPIGAGTPAPTEGLSIASAAGTQFRRLLVAPQRTVLESIRWSPDGHWIAYLRLTQKAVEIRSIRPDGTGDHRITSLAISGQICLYPRLLGWSQDSRSLFYVGFTSCAQRTGEP
jgi:dipeptidyl aminopeptidase/acylaminoacyl peptidase